MFDKKRPFLQSLLLHAILIAGAMVFALPYAWLVGTSWKLDKEVQTEDIRILPDKPIATLTSPWIDPQTFPPIEKPEQVSAECWDAWMKKAVRERIGASLKDWNLEFSDPGFDKWTLYAQLEQGLFRRLLNLLPYDAWKTTSEGDFAAAVDKVLTPSLNREVFDQCHRYFALGTARLITHDYRVYNLAEQSIWATKSPYSAIEPGAAADHKAVLFRYDLISQQLVTAAARFTTPVDLPNPQTGFKRIELSYRGDLSWHDMRVYVEMNGRKWRTESPKYLATDQWSEILVQLPSEDDQRLIPHRYVRLADIGPSDVTQPGMLKVSVELNKSSVPEAYWAKGTENYRKAFEEVPFWRYFKTSAFLVAANIIGTLLSCSLVAYAFARLNWPGRDLCFVLVLATLMIPPQVTMIPSFVIYKHLGWYNTLAPLWVPNALALNGFAIFLLRQAMKGVPKDLEEAAKIDGCSHLRIWWHIMLPLVKPTLAAIAIFTFMFVWNDFMTPLIYVNDQRLYPLALGLFSFMAGRENQFTLIMAGSMIMTLPVIVTFFLAQRYFIQGVAMSGMKN